MPEPKQPTPNRAREHRIEQEIVVDAYTSDERAIGWHCYLDDKLRFPFTAGGKIGDAHLSCPLPAGTALRRADSRPTRVCTETHVVICKEFVDASRQIPFACHFGLGLFAPAPNF